MPSHKKGVGGCLGRGDAFWFDPDALIIVTDKADPLYDSRVNMELSEALVRSIMIRGILDPVLITTGAEPKVIDGRQRVRAAREANKRGADPAIRVPCVMRRGAGDQLAGAAVAANEIRMDDDPTVKAEKAQHLLNLGYAIQDVADDFGVEAQTIRRWLKLAEAPADVRKAVKDKKVSASAATDLSKLSPEKRAAAVDKGASARQVAKAAGSKTTALGKRKVRAEIVSEDAKRIITGESLLEDGALDKDEVAWKWYCAGLKMAAGITD